MPRDTSGEWKDWVRTLANSTNPRDTELLIAKIGVLLSSQKELWLGRAKKYMEEIDNAPQLNDEEKGIARWALENLEIRLSDDSALSSLSEE